MDTGGLVSLNGVRHPPAIETRERGEVRGRRRLHGGATRRQGRLDWIPWTGGVRTAAGWPRARPAHSAHAAAGPAPTRRRWVGRWVAPGRARAAPPVPGVCPVGFPGGRRVAAIAAGTGTTA